MTLVTVRRAEQGHRIIISSLEKMASVLGKPIERYIAHDLISESTEYVIQIEGLWTQFFIEDDREQAPYVAEEIVTIRQDGARIEGEMTTYCPHEVRHEEYNSSNIINNILSGLTYSKDWALPSGLSSFIQLASRNNDWLEGFTSWYDPDSDQIETSRIIAVRQNSSSFSRYVEDAKAVIERDLPTFRLRKLMEAGYGIEDAFAMMTAINHPPNASPALLPTSPKAQHETNLKIEGQEYLVRMRITYEQFLEQLISLDYKNIDYSNEDFEGTAEQWAPIYSQHPECWRVLTKGNRIIGYWHFSALNPETMTKAKDGTLVDSRLTLSDIEPLSLPGEYSIYVTAIICEPEFRFGRSFKMLFNSMFEAIEILAKERVFIKDVVLAAWTPASEKLSQRLGFKKIGGLRESETDVGLYQALFQDVLEADDLKEFSTLRNLYWKA